MAEPGGDGNKRVQKTSTKNYKDHKCPDAFWCFVWSYNRDIRRFLCKNSSDSRPPIESIRGGYAHDISEYMDFTFYSWVKYRDVEAYPQDSIKLGRWLGIAHNVGSAIIYWVLTENGKIIPRSIVRLLKEEEKKYSQEIK